MVKLIKSISKSISTGVKNDPEVQRIKNKHPKLFGFIKKRFTADEKYGLYLTIGIIFTLFFIYIFFGILQDYIGHEAITQFDLRVINLFALLRHPKLTNQMLFITYLAKGEVIALGTVIFLLIFYIYKKWHFINTLLISVLGSEIFVWIIKNIIERPRPPLTNALVTESSYSFPSGHTFVAIAFYGLLSYFIIQSERGKFLKIISFIFFLSLIILIGVSRIYLGAHWPSDVFASFAAGLSWLSILITSLKIKKKFNPPQNFQSKLTKTKASIFSIFLVIIWLIFTIFFYITHPIQPKTITPSVKTTIKTEEIADKLFTNLPKVTESISAKPAEPINIIFVGTKEELDAAFSQSGWYVLDGPSLKSYTNIITSLMFERLYPQTPGLPVFWDTQPNQFAYGKPTSTTSIASREHIHIWDTNFVTESNQSIWVGTAHFDQEIQKKFGIILPYHHTNLKVDDERESIKNELKKNGFIKNFTKINLTGLMYGIKKSSGNGFLTDGQAYIIYLQTNEKR